MHDLDSNEHPLGSGTHSRGSSLPHIESGIGRVAAALAEHRSGHSLPAEMYSRSDVFELEYHSLLCRHWIALGHHSLIPKSGDYFVTELAGESLIVVRDAHSQVQVLANVCRHRGSRLCDSVSGNARAFVCPYHSWTYGLDGRLLQASLGPSDLAGYPVRRFPVRLVSGVIMTCLGSEALDIGPAAMAACDYLDPHACADTVVAARVSYPVQANWKLVLENFLECYHCPNAHPEYCRTNPNAYHFERGVRGQRFASLVARWWDEMRTIGHVFGTIDEDCLDQASGREYYTCQRTPLTAGYDTATRDGKPIAPLLGTLTRFDGGETFVGIGPYSYIFGYGDYLLLFRIIPHTAETAEMELTWLVAADSDVLGNESALCELKWLWHATTEQDVVLTDRNAAGVSSRFYEPGPYSDGEASLTRWTDWYVATLAAEISAPLALIH
jgi:phenylpropionate dioxygenase-like ring-hydroxylating dioxygenase large terminal subunit